jgi:hypothetical protein
MLRFSAACHMHARRGGFCLEKAPFQRLGAGW